MTAEWCGPALLRPLFAGSEDTIFHRVVAVNMAARDVPAGIANFKHLRSVTLASCRVAPETLNRLASVASIQTNNLHISDGGEDLGFFSPLYIRSNTPPNEIEMMRSNALMQGTWKTAGPWNQAAVELPVLPK